MKRATPATCVFFLLTDPETAQKVADRGFVASGVWSPLSAVTLMNQVPRDSEGAIVRVSLAPELVPAAMRDEQSDPSADYRKFFVPLTLLRHAYVTLMTEDESPQFF